MDLEIPKSWVYNEKVPFSESNNVEFKQVAIFSGLFKHKASTVSALPKYRDTLIAFLNGGGGYLFMGIHNDRTIMGVNDMTDEDFDSVITTNLKSAFVACRVASREMMRGKFGRIVNIASTSGSLSSSNRSMSSRDTG
jgi:NAD(P)-dependent dehydrogenase (short-subunit alcohol dehydrogenase family)